MVLRAPSAQFFEDSFCAPVAFRRQPDAHDDDASLSSEDSDSNNLGETLVHATKFFGTIVSKGHNDNYRLNLDDINCYHKFL